MGVPLELAQPAISEDEISVKTAITFMMLLVGSVGWTGLGLT